MSQNLDAALEKLRRGVSAVPDAASESARRERIGNRVIELQRELVQRDRVRRRRAGALLAAAALAVAAVTAVLRESGETTIAMTPDTVRVNVVGGELSVREGSDVTSFARGDVAVPREAVLSAESGAALLRLESSAALELASASRVKLSTEPARAGGRHERVRLLAGRVSLDVPKLASDRELAVETQDALVEVRGTRFAVSIVQREPLAPFTQVDVAQGKVRIRSKDGVRELAAGDSWRSSDAREPAPPPAAKAQVEPKLDAPPAPNPSEQRAKARVPRAQEPAASDLAAQNRLLEAAELAKQSRMPELALERFERLLELYPEAELAHNARVARFRLLDEMGRGADAATAAGAYLARHPRGFAAAEARRLLERQSTATP